MRIPTIIAFASSLLSLSGCSDNEPTAPDAGGGSGGSTAVALELQPFVYAEPELPITLLHDGDPIELLQVRPDGKAPGTGRRQKCAAKGLPGPRGFAKQWADGGHGRLSGQRARAVRSCSAPRPRAGPP